MNLKQLKPAVDSDFYTNVYKPHKNAMITGTFNNVAEHVANFDSFRNRSIEMVDRLLQNKISRLGGVDFLTDFEAGVVRKASAGLIEHWFLRGFVLSDLESDLSIGSLNVRQLIKSPQFRSIVPLNVITLLQKTTMWGGNIVGIDVQDAMNEAGLDLSDFLTWGEAVEWFEEKGLGTNFNKDIDFAKEVTGLVGITRFLKVAETTATAVSFKITGGDDVLTKTELEIQHDNNGVTLAEAIVFTKRKILEKENPRYYYQWFKDTGVVSIYVAVDEDIKQKHLLLSDIYNDENGEYGLLGSRTNSDDLTEIKRYSVFGNNISITGAGIKHFADIADFKANSISGQFGWTDGVTVGHTSILVNDSGTVREFKDWKEVKDYVDTHTPNLGTIPQDVIDMKALLAVVDALSKTNKGDLDQIKLDQTAQNTDITKNKNDIAKHVIDTNQAIAGLAVKDLVNVSVADLIKAFGRAGLDVSVLKEELGAYMGLPMPVPEYTTRPDGTPLQTHDWFMDDKGVSHMYAGGVWHKPDLPKIDLSLLQTIAQADLDKKAMEALLTAHVNLYLAKVTELEAADKKNKDDLAIEAAKLAKIETNRAFTTLTNVVMEIIAANGSQWAGKAIMVDALTRELIPTEYLFVDGGNFPNSIPKAGKILAHPDNPLQSGIVEIDIMRLLKIINDKDLTQDSNLLKLHNDINALGGIQMFDGTAAELKAAIPSPKPTKAYMVISPAGDELDVFFPIVDNSVTPATGSWPAVMSPKRKIVVTGLAQAIANLEAKINPKLDANTKKIDELQQISLKSTLAQMADIPLGQSFVEKNEVTIRRLAYIQNDDNNANNGGIFQKDIFTGGLNWDVTSGYDPSGINPLLPVAYDPKSYQPANDFEKKKQWFIKFKMPNQNPFFRVRGKALWDNRNSIPYNALTLRGELDTALQGTHQYMAIIDSAQFELDITESYAVAKVVRPRADLGLSSTWSHEISAQTVGAYTYLFINDPWNDSSGEQGNGVVIEDVIMLDSLSDKLQSILQGAAGAIKMSDVTGAINLNNVDQRALYKTLFAELSGTNYVGSALETLINNEISTSQIPVEVKDTATITMSKGLDPFKTELSAELAIAIKQQIDDSTEKGKINAKGIEDAIKLVANFIDAQRLDKIYDGVSSKITQVGTTDIYKGVEHTYTKDYADTTNIFVKLDNGEIVSLPITLTEDISAEHYKLDLPNSEDHVHAAIYKKEVTPATTPKTWIYQLIIDDAHQVGSVDAAIGYLEMLHEAEKPAPVDITGLETTISADGKLLLKVDKIKYNIDIKAIQDRIKVNEDKIAKFETTAQLDARFKTEQDRIKQNEDDVATIKLDIAEFMIKDFSNIDVTKVTGYVKTEKQKLVKDKDTDTFHFEDDAVASSGGSSVQKKEYTTLTPFGHKDEIMGIISKGEDISMYLKQKIIGGNVTSPLTAKLVGLSATGATETITIPNGGSIPLGSTIHVEFSVNIVGPPAVVGSQSFTITTLGVRTVGGNLSANVDYTIIELVANGVGNKITSFTIKTLGGSNYVLNSSKITVAPDYTYSGVTHISSKVDEIKINTYGHDSDTHYFFWGQKSSDGTVFNYRDQALTTEDKGYALVVEWVPKADVTIT